MAVTFKVKSFRRKKFYGLIEYKPLWIPSLRGWTISLFASIVFILFVFTHVHSFLSISHPINADVLVVEGWIGDEAIKGALAEYKKNNYQAIITTGLPIPKGAFFYEETNLAEITAKTFIRLGVDKNKVIAVPAPHVKKDRTTASALAFKKWLETTNMSIKAINLYSDDVHTRRSWFLFQKALADKIKVGAIAHPPVNYEAKYWWEYSEGVRAVVDEAVAFLYVSLINWNS